MPRNCSVKSNRIVNAVNNGNDKEYSVYVGKDNIRLWNYLKETLNFKLDCDFVKLLLALAEKFVSTNTKVSHRESGSDDEILLTSTDIHQEGTDCDVLNESDGHSSSGNDVRSMDLDGLVESTEVPSVNTVKVKFHPRNTSKAEKFRCVPQDGLSTKCCICDEQHLLADCPAHSNFKAIISTVDCADPSVRFETVESKHGLSLFTDECIEKHRWFGPLVGVPIAEKDLPDDCTMKGIWEIGENSYLSTRDSDRSNWLRYMRPAPVREQRNFTAVAVDGALYFVSTRSLVKGEEMLYWTDSSGAWVAKNMDRTSCGGCNVKFDHALYYRIHCSVFHEPSLSLTVRKYHCKICSAPVLGKHNMTRHATLLHNGLGAHQCPFCSKFFLKVNYLEVHKSYGCSANPERTRPLCDYCGKKFSQPQKLKVHIKRMHSNVSDGVKEFECGSCLKVLGCKATLQRHMREVHRTPTLSCKKCARAFTNRSNLKIHMLTHSGIKPFRCRENGCNAGYTTKQCLKAHYMRVHGLSEAQVPDIQRAVEYTFNAYSGADAATKQTNATVQTELESDEETPDGIMDRTEDPSNNLEENFGKGWKDVENARSGNSIEIGSSSGEGRSGLNNAETSLFGVDDDKESTVRSVACSDGCTGYHAGSDDGFKESRDRLEIFSECADSIGRSRCERMIASGDSVGMISITNECSFGAAVIEKINDKAVSFSTAVNEFSASDREEPIGAAVVKDCLTAAVGNPVNRLSVESDFSIEMEHLSNGMKEGSGEIEDSNAGMHNYPDCELVGANDSSVQHPIETDCSVSNDGESELDVTGDCDIQPNFCNDKDITRNSMDHNSDLVFGEATMQSYKLNENGSENKTDYYHLDPMSYSRVVDDTGFYFRVAAESPADQTFDRRLNSDQFFQPMRYLRDECQQIIVDLSHSSETSRHVDKSFRALSPVYIPPSYN